MSLNWAHVAIVYCSFSVDIIIDKVASKFGVFLKKLLVLLLIKVLHGRSVSLGRSALTAHMIVYVGCASRTTGCVSTGSTILS